MNRFRESGWAQASSFILIVSLFVGVLLALAGSTTGVHALAAPLIGTTVILIAGLLLLGLAGMSTVATLPAAFVVGAAATIVAMLALVELLGVVAQSAFLIWAAAVAVAAAASLSRWKKQAAVGPWVDVGAALGLSVLIGFFCGNIASFLPSAAEGATLPAWTDYYIHGTVIASFGDPLAIKQGNILLAGTHRPFYHYGSFMLPAGLLPSSGLPGLGLALATQLPLGLLVGALGLYALIAQLSGRSAALVAILAIACLPDASSYWMQNGFFGFRWLLYTAPGSGYALGVGALAATCLLVGMRAKQYGAYVLAGFLLLSMFIIRLHLFSILAPALTATWLIAQWRMSSKRKAQLVIGCFTLILVAAITALASSAKLLEVMQPLRYAGAVLGLGSPGSLKFYQTQAAWMPTAMLLPLAVSMIFVATLGVFAVALPLVTLLWIRAGKWEVFDWLPWALCGTYALLILLLPPALSSDPTDLKHRPFVMLYAVVGAWTIARTIQLLAFKTAASKWTVRIALSVFAVAVPLILLIGHNSQPGRPSGEHMPWAANFFDSHVESGLVQVGTYIRENSEPGDLLIMPGQATRDHVTSELTELISLADVATYLGRTELMGVQSGPAAKIADKRSSEVNDLLAATSWREACQQMRRIGVRWYVENRAGQRLWDKAIERTAWKSGDFVVYDAGSKSQDGCDRNEPSP